MENLAHMRGFPATASRDGAHRAGTRDRNRSDGVLRDARHTDFHAMARRSVGCVEPLEIEARGRQRIVLAQLVESIAPNQAEETARILLDTFGTLGGVFAASHAAITRTIGNPALASTICLARAAVHEGLREDVRGQLFDVRDRRIQAYFVAKLHGASEERLYAAFLDSLDCYITDELVAMGTSSEITLSLRPLMRRTIELNAASIVLFHNHPSGIARPSEADIAFTCEAKAIAEVVGCELRDHLIVAGPAMYSMRTAGLL